MDGYYETLLSQIKNCMSDKAYDNAFVLLEEEFKMPYIPKEYEEQLIPLYHECKSELNALKVSKKYDENDIETLLFGSIDEAFQAVELLKNSNLRKYLDVIEKYLSSSPHFLIRSLLIECLVEQDIKESITMDYDGLDVSFTPTYVELPQDQEYFGQAIKQVQDYYENDNPSFLLMCVETMIKETYFRLPFCLAEDEINHFIYAILLYVYKANNDKEGFKAFIHEKNLAKYGGYDLLLYEYDI